MKQKLGILGLALQEMVQAATLATVALVAEVPRICVWGISTW